MASSTSTWILSMKAVLISVGIVSIAMATKFSVPLIIDFAVYEVPLMWSTLLSWLRPPYLYLIINGIIIIIAASSRFYQKLDHHTHLQPLVSPKPPPSDLQLDFAAVSNQSEFRFLEPPVVYENEARGLEVNRESVNGLEVGDQDEDNFVILTESEFRVLEPPVVYENEARGLEVNRESVNGLEVGDQDEDNFVISTESEFRVLEPPVVYENEARGLEVHSESVNGLEVGDQDEDKFVISTESEFRVLESPAVYKDEANFQEVNHEVKNGSEVDDIQDEDEFVISNSTRKPPRRRNSSEIKSEYLFPATNKPPVSARFGHRKPVKASPEGGRALKVAKPKRHETLETTWKMITDGRHMPLTRHLRRSEAWENHDRQFNAGRHDASPNKSETFMVDHAYYDPPSSSGKLRKEPSLSQDELNRRVEAFIKKFNQDIRLQKQESLKRYTEMINRGAN